MLRTSAFLRRAVTRLPTTSRVLRARHLPRPFHTTTTTATLHRTRLLSHSRLFSHPRLPTLPRTWSPTSTRLAASFSTSSSSPSDSGGSSGKKSDAVMPPASVAVPESVLALPISTAVHFPGETYTVKVSLDVARDLEARLKASGALRRLTRDDEVDKSDVDRVRAEHVLVGSFLSVEDPPPPNPSTPSQSSSSKSTDAPLSSSSPSSSSSAPPSTVKVRSPSSISFSTFHSVGLLSRVVDVEYPDEMERQQLNEGTSDEFDDTPFAVVTLQGLRRIMAQGSHTSTSPRVKDKAASTPAASARASLLPSTTSDLTFDPFGAITVRVSGFDSAVPQFEDTDDPHIVAYRGTLLKFLTYLPPEFAMDPLELEKLYLKPADEVADAVLRFVRDSGDRLPDFEVNPRTLQVAVSQSDVRQRLVAAIALLEGMLPRAVDVGGSDEQRRQMHELSSSDGSPARKNKTPREEPVPLPRPLAMTPADMSQRLADQKKAMSRADAQREERQKQKLENDRRNALRRQVRSIISQQSSRASAGGSSPQQQREQLAEDMRDKLMTLPMPEESRDSLLTEVERLTQLETSHAEYHLLRNYLDVALQLPWQKYRDPPVDVPHARKVLDADHYGLEEVKDRILEVLAVRSLEGSNPGKIMCLVGPPGVGKTSIGESIGRALNREFTRISMGGVDDVSEIKGHRRTYVGAMPGKFVQALRRLETSDPVILVDEIDKISLAMRSRGGDPSAALLELFDPEQNHAFLDHYLDMPYDFSKALFVCTANDLSPIRAPLLDRMDVIRLDGYMESEKEEIARRYLVPKLRKETGLSSGQLQVSDAALRTLVRDYSPEHGIRTLQRHLGRVFRSSALRVATAEDPSAITPIRIAAKNVAEILKEPPWESRAWKSRKLPAGSCVGLSVSGVGGTTMVIETALNHRASPKSDGDGDDAAKKPSKDDELHLGLPENSSLILTGHMRQVMQESCEIAFSYARRFLHYNVAPDSHFFHNADVHLHCPEGAVAKDGPSAGIAIATALLSLAMDEPVRKKIAMTGELSLTGLVLPVGGIKQKLIGAAREGAEVIILPEANRVEYDHIPDELKQKLQVHFVDTYDEVFPIAFPNIEARRKASTPRSFRRATTSKRGALDDRDTVVDPDLMRIVDDADEEDGDNDGSWKDKHVVL